MNKLQFRKFNIKDIFKCSKLVVDAWPSVSNIVPKGDEIKLASGYVDLARLFSTWLEVACISGNIVGFLFGRIDSDYKMKDKLKVFFSILVMVIKFIIGGYGKISKRFTSLIKFILTEIKVIQNHPKSDGEVTFKNKKARVISVYTSFV